MKAALLVEPGKVEIRDVPAPSPGRGEVLVRIKQAGICGTDYALFLGRLGAELTGLPERDFPVFTSSLVRKELTVLGSMIYRDEFPAAIDLLKRGEMNTGLFISEIHPLHELPQALEDFRSPSRVKTLIRIP